MHVGCQPCCKIIEVAILARLTKQGVGCSNHPGRTNPFQVNGLGCSSSLTTSSILAPRIRRLTLRSIVIKGLSSVHVHLLRRQMGFQTGNTKLMRSRRVTLTHTGANGVGQRGGATVCVARRSKTVPKVSPFQKSRPLSPRYRADPAAIPGCKLDPRTQRGSSTTSRIRRGSSVPAASHAGMRGARVGTGPVDGLGTFHSGSARDRLRGLKNCAGRDFLPAIESPGAHIGKHCAVDGG